MAGVLYCRVSAVSFGRNYIVRDRWLDLGVLETLFTDQSRIIFVYHIFIICRAGLVILMRSTDLDFVIGFFI